jgi:hypothetical protein
MGILGPRASRLLAAATATVAGAACCALLGVTGTATAASVSTASVSTSSVSTASVSTASVSTASVSTASAATGVWGAPHAMLGIAALGGKVWPSSLACSGPGDCLAAGNNSIGQPSAGPPGSSILVGALTQEKRGVWSRSIPIRGLGALSQNEVVQVNAVGCGSPGNCAIGGFYGEREGDGGWWAGSAFLDTERNGSWGTAVDTPGVDSLNKAHAADVTSLSCTAKGDCTGGGYYTIAGQYTETQTVQNGFVIDERNGVWSAARPVPGLPVKNTSTADSVATVLSVSCSSPGNCVAGGSYTPNASGGTSGTTQAAAEAFTVEERNGVWQAARLIPAMLEVTLVSCPAAGDCAAAGDAPAADCSPGYNCPAAYVTEKNGSWGTPRRVLSASQQRAHVASITSLSCGSPGDCVAAGDISDYSQFNGNSDEQAFLLEEKKGTWSGYREVPGTAALNAGGKAAVTSVSCTAAGDCTAGGYYTDRKGTELGFLLTETGFGWGRLATVGFGGVGVVSCFAPASCAALVSAESAANAGSFNVTDYGGVMEKEPVQSTRTRLALSTSHVTYGHEQAARASVTVTAGLGAPGGAVLVESGSTTVCVIGLVSGAGSCTLKPTVLGAGPHALTAYYLGLPQFRTSASATVSLKVTQ